MGRPLSGIFDVFQIMPLEARHVTYLQTGEATVPPRRVVGATLPRVIDRQQAATGSVATLDQIAMPRQEARIQVPNAWFERVQPARLHDIENPGKGNCMHRRLDQTTGCRLPRRHRARPGTRPPISARKVFLRAWVEHNMRDAAIAPLRGEQGLELANRSVRVNVDE